MPPKKLDTVWEAEPHTIAKIAILEGYLSAWLQILGRTRNSQDLLYIDGFAGPGQYTNHPRGSPIAALDAARNAIATLGNRWKAGQTHLAFVERDHARFEHLRELVEQYEMPAGVQTHLVQSAFVDGLAELKRDIPAPFTQSSPLFVFIDPFGATGAPFSAVREILGSPCSEVLINLDADGIARIFHAQEDANYERLLDEIFGDRSWQGRLSATLPFDKLCFEILDLYKSRLRTIQNVRYVFSFEMRSTEALNYFLVFASKHPLGLEKMKEAMKKIDQDGDYRFSDTDFHQRALLRFDDPASYSPRLLAQFQGRRVTYAELRDFALNETPFTNPNSMLKYLEAKGAIQVTSRDPNRRRGTFNEQNLTHIEFARAT